MARVTFPLQDFGAGAVLDGFHECLVRDAVGGAAFFS